MTSKLITKNEFSRSVYSPLYKPTSKSNLQHNKQRKEYFQNYSYNFNTPESKPSCPVLWYALQILLLL